MTLLHFTIRSVYGKNAVYPNNPAAEAVCGLTKKRTFDAADLVTLRDLGFEMAFDGAAIAVDELVDAMNRIRSRVENWGKVIA